MMAIDEYYGPFGGSDEDQICIGQCADQAAQIDSGDSDKTCPALGEVIQDVLDYFQSGGAFSAPQSMPMAEVG
jgi:hypothetical protein